MAARSGKAPLKATPADPQPPPWHRGHHTASKPSMFGSPLEYKPAAIQASAVPQMGQIEQKHRSLVRMKLVLIATRCRNLVAQPPSTTADKFLPACLMTDNWGQEINEAGTFLPKTRYSNFVFLTLKKKRAKYKHPNTPSKIRGERVMPLSCPGHNKDLQNGNSNPQHLLLH